MLTEREINYSQVLHIHDFIIFIINSVVILYFLLTPEQRRVNKRPELVYFKLRTIQLFLHCFFGISSVLTEVFLALVLH